MQARYSAYSNMLSLLYYLPLVNLLVPVLSGLAFTHFCLARLVRERGQ